MSEDKELKQWKEKLFYQPKNGYDRIDAEQAGEIFAYAEGYKQFLDAARTEREAVKEAIRILDGIDDIAICRLTGADVVRHALVQKIIAAYEQDDKQKEKRAAAAAKKPAARKTTVRKKA